MMNKRWFVVILLPVILASWFALNPADNATDYLINGIIMACAATFLLKYVLFALIMAHLRGEIQTRNRIIWQFLPVLLFIAYITFYFLKN